jgi:hypothetical protein
VRSALVPWSIAPDSCTSKGFNGLILDASIRLDPES